MQQTITKSLSTNLVIENEIALHLEDELQTVNAIRNGRIVPMRWEDLTSDERRAANVAMFSLCEWEVSA